VDGPQLCAALRFHEVMPRTKLLLTLVLLSTATALGAPSRSPASTQQEAIFQDETQLEATPAATLDTLRDLGVTRVRVSLYWSRIAPRRDSRRRPPHFDATNPSAYPRAGWQVYDEIVRDAATRGVSAYFQITGTAPLWATGAAPPAGGPYGQWRPSASEFRAFVTAVGRRYSGTYRGLPAVRFWSIWNEPNYGVDLAPQATHNDTVEVGAAQYRALLDAGWAGLHRSGHGRDTILFGEVAPHGLDHPIGNFSGVKPLRFLRALYCVDARLRPLRGYAAALRSCPTAASGSRRFRSQHPALFSASGFADHPYAQGLAPNRSLAPDPDYADLPEIPRLERTLDHLQRVYGSRARLPIWNTEYGYWTNPPERVARINPTTAALYINWAEYLSWRQPRVRSYMQYLLVDPARGNFASGLLFKNGRPKPPLRDAYRMPLYLPRPGGRRGRPLEVWGDVRPAHLAGAGQRVAIQWRPRSGRWQTVRLVGITNLRGYFDVRQAFRGSGGVRLVYSRPAGGTITSRTATITLR